jgi:hypothetical protein
MISVDLSRRLAKIWSTPEMYDLGEEFKTKLLSLAEQKETFDNLPKGYQERIKQVEKAIRKRAK